MPENARKWHRDGGEATGRRRIGSVALVIAAILIGMLPTSPVQAHFVQNTRHLARHAWTDFISSRVFTRAAADRRFVNVTEEVTNLADDVVTSDKIATDAVGSSELASFTRISATILSVAPGTVDEATATCPVGSRVIGGGPSASHSGLHTYRSFPTSDLRGWRVAMRNDGSASGDFVAFALCLG